MICFSSPGGARRLHLCCVKEDSHLCPNACLIKGNWVENIISIFLKGLGPPERIIAGSSDKGVESISALTCNFKTPLGV